MNATSESKNSENICDNCENSQRLFSRRRPVREHPARGGLHRFNCNFACSRRDTAPDWHRYKGLAMRSSCGTLTVHQLNCKFRRQAFGTSKAAGRSWALRAWAAKSVLGGSSLEWARRGEWGGSSRCTSAWLPVGATPAAASAVLPVGA